MTYESGFKSPSLVEDTGLSIFEEEGCDTRNPLINIACTYHDESTFLGRTFEAVPGN